jgi:hypothetical protein
MGSGRGEANLVMKCKFCKCESSAGKITQPNLINLPILVYPARAN